MTDCDNMLHNFQLHTLINIHIDRVTRNMRFAQAYKIRKKDLTDFQQILFTPPRHRRIYVYAMNHMSRNNIDPRHYNETQLLWSTTIHTLLCHDTYILTSIAQ